VVFSSEILRKEKEKEHKSANINSPLETAYEEFSSRLTFDIGKIDSFLDLAIDDAACIIAANKKHFKKNV
jgi:guanylate kinase